MFFILRCVSHTLSLIATTDIDLSKFDTKVFRKKAALRGALAKIQSLWNKIGGHSVGVAEKCFEAFGMFITINNCSYRYSNTNFQL